MKEMDVNGYWYKTTLGELVSAKGGYGFPRELQGRKRGQVAFFKVSDMSRSGNEKWLRAANNYIDNNDMNLLKAKVFPAESVVFPKIGAAIRTNKKRILAQPSVVDNNVMVLTVKQEQILEPIFLYYWMHTVDICDWANNGALPSIPASRVNSIRMSLPPSYEQKKIAAVLSTVQRAIEAQDRIIATTTELKKALMQKLFTEGLHGEPQKQTEIGPVPESWEVVELKHLLYQLDYGTSEKCTYQSDGPPVLRIPNVLSGEIDTKDLKYGPLKLVSSEGLYLKAGDLLFVRTNGVRENAGRCAEYEQSE
jgi:type I restriction enzyme S subunit